MPTVTAQDGLANAILFYDQEHALDREDSLSQSRKGGHIAKQRADQIIRDAVRRANLRRCVYAHLFRHGYAINFLNCGERLDALRPALATAFARGALFSYTNRSFCPMPTILDKPTL